MVEGTCEDVRAGLRRRVHLRIARGAADGMKAEAVAARARTMSVRNCMISLVC